MSGAAVYTCAKCTACAMFGTCARAPMLRALAYSAATSVKLYVCGFVSVKECDDLQRACAGLCIKTLAFGARCDRRYPLPSWCLEAFCMRRVWPQGWRSDHRGLLYKWSRNGLEYTTGINVRTSFVSFVVDLLLRTYVIARADKNNESWSAVWIGTFCWEWIQQKFNRCKIWSL